MAVVAQFRSDRERLSLQRYLERQQAPREVKLADAQIASRRCDPRKQPHELQYLTEGWKDNGRTRTTRWAHEKPPPLANPRRVVDAAAVERSQAAQQLHAERQRAANATRIVEVNTLGGPPPLAVPLSARQKRRLAAQEEAAVRKHVERTRGGGKAEADEKDEQRDKEEGFVGTAAAAMSGGSTARTEQSLMAFVQRAYLARLGRPRDVWGGGPPTRPPSCVHPSWRQLREEVLARGSERAHLVQERNTKLRLGMRCHTCGQRIVQRPGATRREMLVTVQAHTERCTTSRGWGLFAPLHDPCWGDRVAKGLRKPLPPPAPARQRPGCGGDDDENGVLDEADGLRMATGRRSRTHSRRASSLTDEARHIPHGLPNEVLKELHMEKLARARLNAQLAEYAAIGKRRREAAEAAEAAEATAQVQVEAEEAAAAGPPPAEHSTTEGAVREQKAVRAVDGTAVELSAGIPAEEIVSCPPSAATASVSASAAVSAATGAAAATTDETPGDKAAPPQPAAEAHQ